MTLGKRIAENRKRLGLTQDQLAEKLGLTAQAVSKWENDQSCPDITMLPKLAEIFDITTDELLGREVPPKVHTAEVVNDDKESSAFVEVHNEQDGWTFKWDGGRKGAVMFAVMVLMIGGLLLAAKFLHWDVSFWNIAWPCALLCTGITWLLKKFSIFSFGLTLFSGYCLVNNLGIWQLDLAEELIFPLCVVLFGLALLFDSFRKPKRSHIHFERNGKSKEFTSNCYTEDGEFECDVSFGEISYLVKTECLHSGNANISFGELTVDLSGCQQIASDCSIDANCAFGQLNLLVPRCYRVESRDSVAFASVQTKGEPDQNVKGVIHVDANANFGEISIRYI